MSLFNSSSQNSSRSGLPIWIVLLLVAIGLLFIGGLVALFYAAGLFGNNKFMPGQQQESTTKQEAVVQRGSFTSEKYNFTLNMPGQPSESNSPRIHRDTKNKGELVPAHYYTISQPTKFYEINVIPLPPENIRTDHQESTYLHDASLQTAQDLDAELIGTSQLDTFHNSPSVRATINRYKADCTEQPKNKCPVGMYFVSRAFISDNSIYQIIAGADDKAAAENNLKDMEQSFRFLKDIVRDSNSNKSNKK
jgi:hypothetical protein